MPLKPDKSLDAFCEAVGGPDEEIDLARGALLIAQSEEPALDVEAALEGLDALAARVALRMKGAADPMRQIEALNSVIFSDLDIKGAQENYYDPRNSFLDQVLERRRGIPVSIGALYMSVGARAGIALGGTAMPMHFLVRVLGVKPPVFVDVFNGGRLLSVDDCRRAVRLMSRGLMKFKPKMLEVVSNGVVLTRLLTNLKMIYLNETKYASAARVLDRLLVLNPGEPTLLRERGLVHFRLGMKDLARLDLQNYLEHDVSAGDAREIKRILRRIG